jgi:hypothetical protein
MTRTLSDNLFNAQKVFDHLAPSEWLLGIVKSLTGVDVMRELVVPFVGRWGNVDDYGEALTNVSRCLEAVSTDVATISSELGKNWQGLAADAARTNLASIGTSLHSDSETQAGLGIRYRELATAMQCAQVVAEMLLKAVLDTAIEVAVWAAAGASTSQTRVGDVLGYGMATYKTAYLVHLLEEWGCLVSAAREDTEGFLGRRDGGGDRER